MKRSSLLMAETRLRGEHNIIYDETYVKHANRLEAKLDQIELSANLMDADNDLFLKLVPIMSDMMVMYFREYRLKETGKHSFIVPNLNKNAVGEFDTYLGGFGFITFSGMPFLIHAHKVLFDGNQKNIYNINVSLLFIQQ